MTVRIACHFAVAALARWLLWLALGCSGLAMAQAGAAPAPASQADSAMAHFVEAEGLVRQGRLGPARDALADAERLAPGLPFARPEAVQSLHQALAPRAAVAPVRPPAMPWAVPCAVVAGALAAWLLMRLGRPSEPARNGDADADAAPAGWAVPGMNTLLPRQPGAPPTASAVPGGGVDDDDLGPWDDGAVGGGNSDWVIEPARPVGAQYSVSTGRSNR